MEQHQHEKRREVSPALEQDSIEMLGPSEQAEFLELIGQGLSPAAACRKLEVNLRSLRHTIQQDPRFQAECDDVAATLNENVEMALYIAAMKGNVSAQTLWLRKRPPPGWMPDEERRTVSEAWDDLTDEELIKLARTSGLAIPAEIAARLGGTGGAQVSGGISQDTPNPGRRGAAPG